LHKDNDNQPIKQIFKLLFSALNMLNKYN